MEFSSDCESIRTEDFATKFGEYVRADTIHDQRFSSEGSEPCRTPTLRDEKYSGTMIRLRTYQDLTSHKSNNQQLKSEARQSPIKQMYSQTLDLESIATDLFEDQLHNYHDSQIRSGHNAPADSCNTSLHLGNLSNVQPLRRDIMNKFLSKYSSDEEKLSYQLRFPAQDMRAVNGRLDNENQRFQKDKKEVYWKTESNQTRPNRQLLANEDLANDIRLKSLRIQNEIHGERQRKSEYIQEIKLAPQQTPREQLDIKVKDLDQLTERMRKARADRERISVELDNLRNNLKHKSFESRTEKRWANGNILAGENATYGIAVSNPKIQTSQIQLNELNSQLNEKKSYLKDLEDRIRQRLIEIQDLESIGLSKQEIAHVIEERNELYEILRQSEENGNDRYQLEKQLTMAKEDLSLEYKRSREKITKLEEELDNSYKKISGVYEDRDRMAKELQYSKDTIQKQQDDIHELNIERNELRQQIDDCKGEMNSERFATREMMEQEKKRYECHLATEDAQTKIIIADLKNQLSVVKSENISNSEQNSVYRSKMSQLESECRKLKMDLEMKENEFKERIEMVVNEKNQKVEMIRKEFYSKTESEIQNLKMEIDSEQSRTINSLKECYKQQNSDLQMRLEDKSQEIQDLKSDIRRVKQDFSEKESSLKNHYETEIVRLKDDLKRFSENSEIKISTETQALKDRYEGLLKKINQEIDEERRTNAKLKIALEKANSDIVNESELAKRFKMEKISSINKLKETTKEKLQEECKHLKEYYEEELENQLKIIEHTMQEKNSEMITLSKEIRSLREDNSDMKNSFLKTLSNLFDAIQDQCSRMANEGKFILPNFKHLRSSDDTNLHEIVQLTIKNYQICCQEYSQYFHEFKEKMEEDKNLSVKLTEEKCSRDMQAITEQILKDHADELNANNTCHKHELQTFQQTQQEEIECLRRNIKDWKQKTADRLAQKLQKEFCKEIERKSNNQDLHKSSSLSLHSFKNEVNPSSLKSIGLIEDLRSNIRQLRDENLSLRKVILGQNDSQMLQYGDQRFHEYHSQNGSIHSNQGSNRPQSVGPDNYRQRHNSIDVSMARNDSYKFSK